MIFKIFLFPFVLAITLTLSFPWLVVFEHLNASDSMVGGWILMLASVVLFHFCTTPYWRLAAGRSLLFSAALGLSALPVAAFLEGGATLIIAGTLVFLFAFFAGYRLLKFKPVSDPHALHDLAARLKHLKNFQDHFGKDLEEWVKQQETRRKKSVRRMWIGVSVTLPVSTLIVALLDYFIFPENEFFGWVDAILFGILVLAGGTVSAYPLIDLQDEIKSRTLEKILTYFDGLSYTEKLKKFDAKQFSDAGLIHKFDHAEFGESFHGHHGNIEFTITEADLEEDVMRDGKKEKDYVFSGLLVSFEFPQPFHGHTVILRDKGKIGNKFENRNVPPERINLVYNKFEKMFEVYSTDQIEARTLLTPDVMEDLIELGTLAAGKRADMVNRKDKTATPVKMELAFKGNALMICIESLHDFFEIGALDSPMEDTTVIAKLVRQVGLVYEIADILELNWKKQAQE